MRTPKEYTQNLKQKIITKQMLADCLYSVNKRAKNCRDNEHKYSKYRTDYYGNADNYRQQKEEYYSQKDKMLTLLKPNCIHETTEYHKERVYDYEPEYYEIYDSGNYLRSSGYYDKELHEYVEFVVVNVPHGERVRHGSRISGFEALRYSGRNCQRYLQGDRRVITHINKM